MENFKDMIRFLADFKMNTLIFYFEDTFRFGAIRRLAMAAVPDARAGRRVGSVCPAAGNRDCSGLRDAGQPGRALDA